jgi:hypothetical protein
LQVTAAEPAIVRGPNPSLVNTLQVSFPVNGGAINQQTLRGELTHAGGMVIASKGKSVTLSSPLLTQEAAQLLNAYLPGAQFQADRTRATGDLAVVIRY